MFIYYFNLILKSNDIYNYKKTNSNHNIFFRIKNYFYFFWTNG